MNDSLEQFAKKFNPKYISDYRNFQPGRDKVLYSGPYWDNKEITAILQ
jgi:hypothetical protein